jgi:hypothetical protein
MMPSLFPRSYSGCPCPGGVGKSPILIGSLFFSAIVLQKNVHAFEISAFPVLMPQVPLMLVV